MASNYVDQCSSGSSGSSSVIPTEEFRLFSAFFVSATLLYFLIMIIINYTSSLSTYTLRRARFFFYCAYFLIWWNNIRIKSMRVYRISISLIRFGQTAAEVIYISRFCFFSHRSPEWLFGSSQLLGRVQKQRLPLLLLVVVSGFKEEPRVGNSSGRRYSVLPCVCVCAYFNP